MKLNAQTLVKWIDCFTEWTGRCTAWLVLAMVLLVCYDVMMRYLFQQGSVALQELEWHLFALVFLFGAAYTLKHDEHVRVDIVYRSRFVSDSMRAWISIIGTVLFLLPFSLLIMVTSWPFVENAFFYNEGSPDPGGLPYRFILKSAILISFGMIILQGVAEILRNIQILRHQEAR
ncbi:TRAP transporter small permease subunit [Methylophaga sp. OBS4]|uniref:TRAP transporter small permease subunit n=1 Tax=Methylophaga sp. OBS4 TaxID=2991935 RepID=UPI002250DA8D|nr:TRAP transporter small permease subunit [Methylophaga sp. OBS4]MCX4186628.1 TRAP transporter small permease subunit [Methylophaga sp. OBS4]